MKLDINYRKKKKGKNTDSWRLNSTLLSNEKIAQRRNKKEIKRLLKNKTMKARQPKPMGFRKNSSKRKIIAINSYLRKQEKKASNRQPNSISKAA